jgi:hypothetical protein
MCTLLIKSRIAMAKATLNDKFIFFSKMASISGRNL